MTPKVKVYIASPYTKGDAAINVRRSLLCANALMDAGFAPYAPLLTHFQHMLMPRAYEDWLAADLEWVTVCDVVLRLEGESNGADKEVAFALQHGIPVVYSVQELVAIQWRPVQRAIPLHPEDPGKLWVVRQQFWEPVGRSEV